MALSTEDKLEWCSFGEALENKFVSQVDVLGWDISINPEKSDNKVRSRHGCNHTC